MMSIAMVRSTFKNAADSFRSFTVEYMPKKCGLINMVSYHFFEFDVLSTVFADKCGSLTLHT